jgi:hypothetical protein
MGSGIKWVDPESGSRKIIIILKTRKKEDNARLLGMDIFVKTFSNAWKAFKLRKAILFIIYSYATEILFL